MLELASSPGALAVSKLYLGYSTGLSEQAGQALLDSPFVMNLESLELHELGVSPETLGKLARKSAQLILTGGYSSDWNGPEYTWPSVGTDHLEAIVQARPTNLRSISLTHQELSQVSARELLARLPQLERVDVDGQTFTRSPAATL